MKSIIFIACLILSANAAPQKTVGLEQETKSAKLQFTPADAQVYTSALPKVAAVPVSTIDQVNAQFAGSVVGPQVISSYDQVIPAYYSGASVYQPGVVRAAVYPGDVPYYSAGRSTATSIIGANGLPAGTVYEHHGTTHVGHSANAVHIKRNGQPGQWYNPAIVGSPLYANPIVSGVAGAVATPVPAHLIPAHLYAATYEGQTQWISGQPAQKVNGQWYWISSAAAPAVVNPLVNQYSSVYTNLRSNVLPVAPTYAGKAYIQPGTQYTQSVLGYRPAVQQDNKWYTKTNTQQIAQPFWSQGQVVQAATGTKSFAVPKPEQAVVAAEEKADWKS